VINQRITEWQPPFQLSFEMESNTLGLERHIASMVDTFTVDAAGAGSRLSRRTVLETPGIFALPKACLFRISLWHIHRYVMRNFKVLAEAT
jgi:hypothetical protein